MIVNTQDGSTEDEEGILTKILAELVGNALHLAGRGHLICHKLWF